VQEVGWETCHGDQLDRRGRTLSLKSTHNRNLSGYFPMTRPANIAIYAFGGFMLFALAIGFFAAPV